MKASYKHNVPVAFSLGSFGFRALCDSTFPLISTQNQSVEMIKIYTYIDVTVPYIYLFIFAD